VERAGPAVGIREGAAAHAGDQGRDPSDLLVGRGLVALVVDGRELNTGAEGRGPARRRFVRVSRPA